MTLTGGPQIRLEARIRERSNCVIDGQCQLWSSDRMFHNYCSPLQRDRDAVLPECLSKMSHEWMNVKRKRNECMTDWMNEWMNQLCSPASWGVHSNEYSPKARYEWRVSGRLVCIFSAWVSFQKQKQNKRNTNLHYNKRKTSFTIVCDSKIPWILLK